MFLNSKMIYLSQLVVLFFILIVGQNLAIAEKLDIYNLSFPYSHKTLIDQDQLQIEIGDRSEIIASSELPNFLVEYYFFQSNSEYTLVELQEFLKSAILEDKQELISLVIKKVVANKSWTFAQAADFFGNISPEVITQVALKEQTDLDYQLTKDSELGKYFLFLALENYSSEFLVNCCSAPYTISPAPAFFLKEQLSSQVPYNEITNNFYRKKSILVNTDVLKTLREILTNIQNLDKNDTRFLKSYNAIKSDYPTYYQQLKPYLELRRKQSLQYAIKNNNFQLALDLLLLQDLNERTEETHQQLGELLIKISDGYAPLLIIEPYRSYLQTIANKDYRVKDLLVSKIQQVIIDLIQRGKVFESKEFFPDLFSYRPNPSPENNNLIFLLIQGFDREGLRDEIYLVRDTYDVNFSFKQGYWFFKNGYYFSLVFVWIIVLLILAFFALVYFKAIKINDLGAFFRILKRDLNLKRKDSEPEFVNDINQQLEKLDVERLKLRSLLKYFDLDDSATLEQVKHIYRKKIKAHHPDLNPNQGEFDKLKFLEITERYEELSNLFAKLSSE